MTQIAVAPFTLKNVDLKIDADNYEKHVSAVSFDPKVDQVTWQGLTPDAAFTDTTSPTWTCTLEYAQDWETTNSLAAYLLANAGQQKTVIFKPRGAVTGKPMFTATVIIVPGPIGGKGNTVQTGQVTLGVVGAPVKGVSP